MLKIEKIDALGGKVVRGDVPIEELGISSYEILRKMISEGKVEESLKLLDYVQHEFKSLHDLYTDWTYIDLKYIAEHYGEEEIEKYFRYVKKHLDMSSYKVFGAITILDLVKLFAEGMRAHRCGPGETGNFKVWEEKDRYVMEFDPCGSGGRMRRAGELDNNPPRTGAPFNFGCTKKGYLWSWGKKGVPYYCLHCAIWHEIMAIEKSGVPIKITHYDDDPAKPCRWYFYKTKEAIPEEYYERIGMKKEKPMKVEAKETPKSKERK